MLLPAEIVPASASPDPTGRWLTFLARSTTTSSAANGLTLCVLELRPSGQFRDLADLGSDQRRPTTAPVAWTPTRGDPPTSQLAFVKPIPGATPNAGGLFDLFGTLRPSTPASALFVVDVNAAREHGITVTNIPTYGTASVAELTFALLLELCHHVALHSEAARAGEWS